MNTRLSHPISAGVFCIALCFSLAMAVAPPGVAQEPAAQAAAAPAAETQGAPADEGAVSEAAVHLRKGVELYNKDLWLEALSEFNRALALDPQLKNAQEYRDKCNSKLELSATGVNAGAVQTFDVVDPQAIPAGAESPQLSAEELKVKRVAELLKQGEALLENQRYKKAVAVFEEVLRIAPDNQRAQQGLHKAVIGASKEDVIESEKGVNEDRARIQDFIEKAKSLPDGADPTGIKPYRITVPSIEEEYAPVAKVSDIEKTLESPVSVEFENIHLSEIVEFISDSYDVNIVIDDRVVKQRPQAAPAQRTATPGTPGMPPVPGQPGLPGVPTQQFPPTYPTPPGMQQQPRPFGGLAQQQYQSGQNAPMQGITQYVTDGMVPYINLKDVTLREALKAVLRPLDLSFAIQPKFIWISTPERIRQESFEECETRIYELRNAGADTLFKIVLRNPGGMGGGGMGGYGGGMGGYGGGMGGYGGGMGGYGGGMGGYGGGMGGYGGGGMGGYGGGMGGYGGGGMGGYGGGRYGGGMGGGGMGGYGGGMGGYGGGMGGYGGGMGGYGGRGMGGYGGGMGGYGGGMGGYGGGGIQISNISQLFGNINDEMVGEPRARIGTVGLGRGGTGQTGTAQAGRPYGAGMQGAGGQARLGGTAGVAEESDSDDVISLLSMFVDDVYEPNGTEPISWMRFIPRTNQLLVHNTPSNLATLEKYLPEIDVTPKQVSIEAKFLSIKTEDLNKVGFTWDVGQSDKNSRNQKIPEIDTTETYQYDINGDGVDETIPFYSKPDGSNVITNTISEAIMKSITAPGPPGAFSLSGIITANQDGDKISVVMDYLDSLEESELLSAPRVTTMNRKPAVIADLSSEYFVTEVDTIITTAEAGFGGTASIGYSQNVRPQQFNFGITLSVTPQISGNDQVRLWLNPQVTTRGTEKKFTQTSVIDGQEVTSEITLPNTTTQAVWTNVIVHDGDTLVLGGLVTDQTTKGVNKMPYLADIPVLGFFFRGKSRQVKQSSLLIFVTPTIIDTTGARFFEAGTASSQSENRRLDRGARETVAPPSADMEEPMTQEAPPLEPSDALEPVAPTEAAPAEAPAEAPASTT